MIIQCQTCRARFRLDDSKITGQGVRVRCRKCGDSIVVLRPGAGPADRPRAGQEANSLDLRSLIRVPAPGAPEDPTPKNPGAPAPRPAQDEVDAAFEQLLADTVGMKLPPPPAPPRSASPGGSPDVSDANHPEPVPPAPSPPPDAGSADRPPLLEPYALPREEASGENTAGGEAGTSGRDRPGFHVDFAPDEKLTFAFEPDSSGSLRAEHAGASGRDYDITPTLRPAPDPGGAAVPASSGNPSEPSAGRAESFHEELATMREFGAPPSSSPIPTFDIPPPPEPQVAEEAPSRMTEGVSGPPVFQAGVRRPAEPRSRSPIILLLALLLVLGSAGAYLSYTPDGKKTMSWLVERATVLWTGEQPTLSGYEVNNLIGYYETNAEAGRMFIIKGQAVNAGRTHKSGIRIQATLLGADGREVAGKTVYAGNVLGGDELRRASREKIEAGMTNRFGTNLINIDIAPGKPVPFMVVFFGAPEGIDAYRIEARDGD